MAHSVSYSDISLHPAREGTQIDRGCSGRVHRARLGCEAMLMLRKKGLLRGLAMRLALATPLCAPVLAHAQSWGHHGGGHEDGSRGGGSRGGEGRGGEDRSGGFGGGYRGGGYRGGGQGGARPYVGPPGAY